MIKIIRTDSDDEDRDYHDRTVEITIEVLQVKGWDVISLEDHSDFMPGIFGGDYVTYIYYN